MPPPPLCSITAAVVHFTAAGSCVLDANQAGNANYNAAAQVQQTFTVARATRRQLPCGPCSVTIGVTYTPTATATSADPSHHHRRLFYQFSPPAWSLPGRLIAPPTPHPPASSISLTPTHLTSTPLPPPHLPHPPTSLPHPTSLLTPTHHHPLLHPPPPTYPPHPHLLPNLTSLPPPSHLHHPPPLQPLPSPSTPTASLSLCRAITFTLPHYRIGLPKESAMASCLALSSV